MRRRRFYSCIAPVKLCFTYETDIHYQCGFRAPPQKWHSSETTATTDAVRFLNHSEFYGSKTFQIGEGISGVTQRIPSAERDSLQRRMDDATMLNAGLMQEIRGLGEKLVVVEEFDMNGQNLQGPPPS